MILSRLIPFAVLAVVLTSGCASTTVTARTSNVGNEKIARPDRILVYDFAATADDLIEPSATAAATQSYSAEEIEAGRRLGMAVAQSLVEEIRAMGLPAARAATAAEPVVGDILIAGHFASIDEGSTMKRLTIGFGSGSAEVRTFVEGYLVTEEGLWRLGSRELKAGGGKSPGVIVPIAATVATANPIGLVVGGAVKVAGEASGRDTIEGAGRRTAKQIAVELRAAFERQGWI